MEGYSSSLTVSECPDSENMLEKIVRIKDGKPKPVDDCLMVADCVVTVLAILDHSD